MGLRYSADYPNPMLYHREDTRPWAGSFSQLLWVISVGDQGNGERMVSTLRAHKRSSAWVVECMWMGWRGPSQPWVSASPLVMRVAIQSQLGMPTCCKCHTYAVAKRQSDHYLCAWVTNPLTCRELSSTLLIKSHLQKYFFFSKYNSGAIAQ